MRMRTALWILASSFTVTGAACSSGAPGAAEVTGTAQLAEQTVTPTQGDAAPATDAGEVSGKRDGVTRTPIKHVVVIVGENRTFDHVFATYKPTHRPARRQPPRRRGSSTKTARPGRTSASALQRTAVDNPASSR